MGRRPDIDGREVLLKAALTLFAREGVDGVSIRAVNREAGVGPATAHYHFGTKDGLIDAIIARHSDTITAEMDRRAQELLHGERELTARSLVEVLTDPYRTLHDTTDEGAAWIKVMGQLIQADPHRASSDVDSTMLDLERRLFPGVPEADLDKAMRMAFQLMVAQFSARRPTRKGAAAAITDDDYELLVDFLSGGLSQALGQPVTTPA